MLLKKFAILTSPITLLVFPNPHFSWVLRSKQGVKWKMCKWQMEEIIGENAFKQKKKILTPGYN